MVLNYHAVKFSIGSVAIIFGIMGFVTPPKAVDPEKYSFLSDLNDKVLVDGKSISAGPHGIFLQSLRGTKCDATHVLRCKSETQSEVFRRKLIANLRDEKSWLGAYALLNQLYPDKELDITVLPFPLHDAAKTVPVIFKSSPQDTVVFLRLSTFGEIAADYWSEKLLPPPALVLPPGLKERQSGKLQDEVPTEKQGQRAH